jgi:hypothetical protein
VEISPEITDMTVRLAELGARGTVSGIRARISTSKAAKRDRDIIETLEDIVDELLADRAEILGLLSHSRRNSLLSESLMMTLPM